jgi:hypothetical protein
MKRVHSVFYAAIMGRKLPLVERRLGFLVCYWTLGQFLDPIEKAFEIALIAKEKYFLGYSQSAAVVR